MTFNRDEGKFLKKDSYFYLHHIETKNYLGFLSADDQNEIDENRNWNNLCLVRDSYFEF